jgi:hypothetical protein
MQNGFHFLALVLFPLPVHDDAAVKRIDDESCSHGFAMHPMNGERADRSSTASLFASLFF